MNSTLMLGDLICCLYDEYSEQYGDCDLAALAADVELNDLLVLLDVHDLVMEDEDDESEMAWH
jgi:hypothetical protein